MNVLGIIGFGQNPAACLMQDGVLVAFAEEERFTRIKGSDGLFPAGAITYCLSGAGIELGDVDRIAFGWDSSKYPWTMARVLTAKYVKYRGKEKRSHHVNGDSSALVTAAETLMRYHPSVIRSKIHHGMRAAGLRGDVPPVEFVTHHMAHACSAYYCSGFDRAGVLTLDGSGEDMCTQLAVAVDDDIRVVESVPIPHSLGWFYAALTEYLGFRPYRDEGRLMGLAALGEERAATNRWVEPLSKVLSISHDSYELDPTYTKFGGHYYGSYFTDELVRLIKSVDETAEPIAHAPRVDSSRVSPYLAETYIDIAWAAQELLERAAITMARRLVDGYGMKNLCLAGGVALNCKMNGEILRRSGCENIYVQPAPHDAGTALGAAMSVARDLGDDVRQPLDSCHYGPGFTNDEIQRSLKQLKIPYEAADDIEERTAELLADGKIVAWFQGRMEFGARALGGRSILANPTRAGVKDLLNAEVKYRESWRPFCPSLIEERKDDYIVAANEASTMTVAYDGTPLIKRELPGVVHVDGTIRPQTVSQGANPRFHDLLTRLGKHTGHPVVLNTSFNVCGEPIVCTPLEAVRCFYSSGIDALVLGDFVLEKSPVRRMTHA